MRRKLLATLWLIGLMLSSMGCGATYEKRLKESVENIKYSARLDKYLNPAPQKPAFDRYMVFVRPPKPMVKTEVFQLATLVPGQFEIAETFADPESGANLHVLARFNKAPKQAKNAPAPPPRGLFESDLKAILAAVYGDNEDLNKKPKPETKKYNKYQAITMALPTGRDVRVYIQKQGEFNVALIWDYPTAQRSAIASKMNLSLESFASGNRAKDAFAGKIVRDDSAPGASSTAVF
jgi:hypothetical protein